MIQAILFDNKKWTTKKAKEWLRSHDYTPIKPVHITKNYLRYRLVDPQIFSRFSITKLPNDIELVIGYL